MTISPATVPNWTVNVVYSQALTGSDCTLGLCTWSVSGNVPPGLSLMSGLVSGSAVLSGTPTTTGIYTFTVTASVAALLDTGSQTYTVTINPAPSITTASLPNGTAGVAYPQTTMTASGGTGGFTWSSSGLPNALTLSSSGVITGTPTTAGSPTVTITVTDSVGAAVSRAYTLTINPAPPPLTITTNSLANGTVGVAYPQTTMVASGGTPPYSWSPASLASGLTLSAGGVITGTPTTAGAFPVTITVTDSAGATAQHSYTLTINAPPLTITTSSLPNGGVNKAYSQTVVVTGGTPPYTFSKTAGSLPANLSLDSNSGAITGTPNMAGSYGFTITVTDKASATASQGYTVVISPANTLTITTSSLPNGTVDTAYSQTVAVVNGTPPYTFSVSAGSLPSPLTLNAANGAITGTPNTAGQANFTITVTDNAGATASQAYMVTINPATPALTITTSSLPSDPVGTPYSQTLTATGGTSPYTWSLASGNLPSGLSITSSGIISGTPTTAGSFSFAVKVTDTNSTTALMPLAITATSPQASGMTISPATLPNWTVGILFSQGLTGSDCTLGLCTWSSSGNLPPGLSLGSGLVSGTAVLSGTPTTTGTYTFTVTASIAALLDSGSQTYTVTINAAPQITTTSLPNGQAGTAYSYTVQVANGTPPYGFLVSANNLPDGLSLNASTGVINGTPKVAGSSTFTITASDAAKATTSKTYTVNISAASVLTITTSSLPNGTVGILYSQTLTASGGATPYTWSISSGSLPNPLSIDQGTGTISGTPTTAGSSTFTVKVIDQNAATALMPLTLTISSSAPTLTLNGVPASAISAQQIAFTLTLSSGYGTQVTGQVTLTFQPNAAVSADDPAIQFSSGSRTAAFTIPANSTSSLFATSPVAFQTGTIAGTITLTVTSDLPGGNLTQTVTVARAAPAIQSASVTQNASGFQVQVIGFSNTRELAGASFHFTAITGQTVQTSDLSVSLSSLASQWFSSASSSPFGGQFLLIVPFTIQQGAASGLASVAVQLQNALNTSAAVTANF
jgi:hypothetical protein